MIKDILIESFVLKNKGHYKRAIESLYKALEIDNSSPELLYEIAELYYKIDNEEKALSYIEQILEKTPHHTNSLRLLKQIFINKKALPEAEQAAKNIYCISQKNDDLVEIFKLLNQQQKYDEIFEYKIKNPDLKIYLEQIKASFGKKDFDNSIKIVNTALTHYPDNEKLLLLLGQIYYSSNQKEKCIELCENLPDNNIDHELCNFKGLVEYYKGNYDSARKYILFAIRISPNDSYYYNLANVYFKNGDIIYAKKYYNLAIANNSENKSYHFALAKLYYSEKKYSRALEEIKDDYFEANILRTIILYETGYLTLAKKELEKLLSTDPENKILLEYKSKINHDLGIQ